MVPLIAVPPSEDDATTTDGVVLGDESIDLAIVCVVDVDVELMPGAPITILALVGVESKPTVATADGDPGAVLAVMILVIATGLPPLLNCALIVFCSLDFVDPPAMDTDFSCPAANGIRELGDE